MTTAVLSPSEGLISRHLTHWIKVSEAGKGGSRDHLGRGWTFLAAWDIQERVAELDHVELSIQTIYRALKSLVAKGWFIRQKLNAGRYRDQTYHYTFGDNHPANQDAKSNRSNASDQPDKPQLIKTISSYLKITPLITPSNSHKTEDIRPGTAEQPNSLDKEEADQPLRSIADAAPTALLEELKGIEANYQQKKQELSAVGASSVVVEKAEDIRAHNPKVEQTSPPLPQSGGRKGSAWERIRALAAMFDPEQAGKVSPKAIITKDGQRLNVSDGATAPLR